MKLVDKTLQIVHAITQLDIRFKFKPVKGIRSPVPKMLLTNPCVTPLVAELTVFKNLDFNFSKIDAYCLLLMDTAIELLLTIFDSTKFPLSEDIVSFIGELALQLLQIVLSVIRIDNRTNIIFS